MEAALASPARRKGASASKFKMNERKMSVYINEERVVYTIDVFINHRIYIKLYIFLTSL